VQEPLPYRNTAKKSSNTVTIACNLPSGLILQGWDMVDTTQPVQGGGSKTVQEARASERLGTFKVKGNAVVQGMPTSHLLGGYAITRGCPADLWENWLHFFKDSPLVTSRAIYAHEKTEEVKAMTRDNKGTKSGLERINPDDPGAKTGIRRIKREEHPGEADHDDED
jgi:hypothetical protein